MRQRAPQFEQLDARIILISFGTAAGGRAWAAETGAAFTLLLDPRRAAYQAYGLEHSLWRSWGPRTIWHYARLLLSGRPWRGIQGDSGQLGGDFVVDHQGVVRLAYRSHDPADRPSADLLLAAAATCPPLDA